MSSCLGTSKNQRDNAGGNRLRSMRRWSKKGLQVDYFKVKDISLRSGPPVKTVFSVELRGPGGRLTEAESSLDFTNLSL